MITEKTIHHILKKTKQTSLNSCWLYLGYLTEGGYGRTTLDVDNSGKRRCVFVHRVSYEYYKGPIPKGLQIDHLCFQRNCLNPGHLEAVTPQENSKRAKARKSHCIKGHAFEGDNLLMVYGHRQCKTCRWKRSNEYYHRNKEKIAIKGKKYHSEYRVKNKGRIKAWKIENKERVREYRKQYYARNKK